jgi:hypothetical protein
MIPAVIVLLLLTVLVATDSNRPDDLASGNS